MNSYPSHAFLENQENLKLKCDRNICNSPVVEVRFALGGILDPES